MDRRIKFFIQNNMYTLAYRNTFCAAGLIHLQNIIYKNACGIYQYWNSQNQRGIGIAGFAHVTQFYAWSLCNATGWRLHPIDNDTTLGIRLEWLDASRPKCRGGRRWRREIRQKS